MSSTRLAWLFAKLVVLLIPVSGIAEVAGRQNGVCWVAALHPVTSSDFEPLLHNHVNWISQTTFGWHRESGSPSILIRPDADWWGESDVGIVETAKLARQLGIKVRHF
jgi:hypothetical protein